MVLIQKYRLRWAALVLTLGLCALALTGWSGAPAAHAQTSATMLSGFVFDYNGEFVAGATIHLYRQPEHIDSGLSATSDANGAWALDTGTGSFTVSAEAPGYNKSEQTVYATSYQTGISSILRPMALKDNQPLVATISGRVTSADDVALGGVSIIANDRQDTGVRQIAPPPILSATVTDADGYYSLQVPAGTIWMSLKTGAAWGYQLVPRNITVGQTVTAADFQVAIRVLPRTEFPTATAVPATAVPPTATPQANTGGVIGMPSTGNPVEPSLWALLIGVGLLSLLAGRTLVTRRRS